MSSHSVRVNTFLHENNKLYLDPISKAFIITEAVFGFFRLPLIRNRKFLFYLMSVSYVMFLNVLNFTGIVVLPVTGLLISIMKAAHIFQFAFCSTFGFVCMKRLQLFYSTLNRFDLEVGCRPKASHHCLQNLTQTILTVVLYCVLCAIPTLLGIGNKHLILSLLLNISYALEVDFYGHLLSIVVPRLKLINYYIESSMSNVNTEPSSLMKEFVSVKRGASADLGHYRMKKLMDLYHVMVEAYDYLIDAIKWQLLVIIITSFISILGFLYLFSSDIIKAGEDAIGSMFFNTVMSVTVMIPLFAPCYFGDQVHLEVKRLRELLACRLYENKLDKSGRSIARALLAFTETRDLSFRLLRMLNIDISLPFKFMGLLVTYLIILLQFDKVLSPGTIVHNTTFVNTTFDNTTFDNTTYENATFENTTNFNNTIE